MNLTAYDWATVRGEKWCDHLAAMEAMLRAIDEPLIRALHLDAPWRIADVGCGGGGTALAILRHAPVGSLVHGFDVSPALIKVARDRTRSDHPAIAFEIADMATAVPEVPYERLVSRFGILFFDEPQAAFTNLARWLMPGGRFAFAVWGDPSENPWIMSVREVVAAIIDLPLPNPKAPGPFRYADADMLLTLLAQAGLGELDVQDWRGTLPMGGGLPAAEAADFVVTAFASFAELLAAAGDEAIKDARQQLMARFSQHQRDDAVWLDASVHIVTGVCLEPGAGSHA